MSRYSTLVTLVKTDKDTGDFRASVTAGRESKGFRLSCGRVEALLTRWKVVDWEPGFFNCKKSPSISTLLLKFVFLHKLILSF